MRTRAPTRSGGRLLHGLLQALAVWVAVLAVVPLVRHVAFMWAAPGAALLAVLVLGLWHQRHARPDTAVGAFTGAVLWPLVAGASLIAINIVSTGLSDVE